jgi:hypothetical protein
MKHDIIADIYINNVKVLYKIIHNKSLTSYELENDEIVDGSKFKKVVKKVHCNCGNITELKHVSIDKKFQCKSCRKSGENNPMYGKSIYDVWVSKYGKSEADIRWKKRSEKYVGKNNHFFSKKHKDKQKESWAKNMLGKYAGENNPMYGKSVYDIWVDKYGKVEADERMFIANLKRSLLMSGENNPMYCKSVYGIWVDKYGKVEADERMKLYKSNLITTITKIKETDRWYEILDKISNSLKDRNFSDVHRNNLRIAMLKHIKKFFPKNKPFQPNFSPKGCEYFDKLEKEHNIKIQHALNGGEYHIEELGYFLDGYDKQNNIVYEYDEVHHFNKDGKLKEKDIKRQKEIEEFLKCKFIRIKA